MANRAPFILFDQQPQLYTAGLQEYGDDCSSPPSDLLRQLEQEAGRAGIKGMMLVERAVGRLLKLLAATLQPALAMDIGTYTGYSALCIAEGLPQGARVVTVDNDADHARAAAAHFAASPYRDRIDLRVGPACEIIRSVDRPIGLAFIDAEKSEYWEYYDLLVDRLAPNGLLLVDNTLLLGSVLLPPADVRRLSPRMRIACEAITSFNRRVAADPRTEQCLLTIGDGVTMIRRRSDGHAN